MIFDHTAMLGGGEIALLNLVRNLDATHFTPIVVLASDGPLRERLLAASVQTHLIPLSSSVTHARKDRLGLSTLLRLGDVVACFTYVFRLARFIQAHRIDLVHTNSLKADLLGGVAGRLAGRPVLWHIRDRIDGDYLPAAVVKCFRFLCRVIPTYVVANSAATLRTLSLKDAVPSDTVYSGIESKQRTRVVHDGVADDQLNDISASERAPVIGLVGRIARWKGQHVFIDAASIVHQHFPAAKFQIIGAALFEETDYEMEIKNLVKQSNLSDVVEFLGFRSDVPDLIRKLNVLVHASITAEPFGQVVIEAMSAGKPVVATAGGGVLEIVADGQTGMLVPMGDAQSMAQAIIKLLKNPAAAAEMGVRGRERMLAHFTIERTARKMESVYDSMLRRSGR
jgi:glycosyltransferase involved in cell wall biosynthesis